MHLELIPYSTYESNLPQQGNHILGQTRGSNIIVYQAFNDAIADYAVANQKFGGPAYSFTRMTWIKPNFLWMMYRSGWAQKENQNRVLAIEISLEGFFELLKEGVVSSYDPCYGSHEEWKRQLELSDVRIQWDPDHGLHGEKLKRRAVQIGIRDGALQKFNDEYIQRIDDISSFVKVQFGLLQSDPATVQVALEKVIEVDVEIRNRYDIPIFQTSKG